MYIRRDYSDKSPSRQARRRNMAVGGGSSRPQHKQARRTINSRPNVCAPLRRLRIGTSRRTAKVSGF
jgi:hypothetical protein